MGHGMGQRKSTPREKFPKMQKKLVKSKDFTSFLARREGFEPPAFWSVARRSIQLS